MSSKETIQFLFKFVPQYTTSPPMVEIINNGLQLLPPQEILKTQEIEIQVELDGTKHNVLEIKRSNHNGTDSQLLALTSLWADGIDLKQVLNGTKFYPEYPLPWYDEQVSQGIVWPEWHQGWLEWGWNGTWKMSYDTPFYDWLLKEL